MKNNHHRGSSLDSFLEEEKNKEKWNHFIAILIASLVSVLLVTIALLCNPSFTKANTIYSWQSIDGSKSFTNMIDRIPTRYHDGVEMRYINGLKDYFKYTPIENKKNRQEKLMQRLKQLRKRKYGRNSSWKN